MFVLFSNWKDNIRVKALALTAARIVATATSTQNPAETEWRSAYKAAADFLKFNSHMIYYNCKK